MPASRPHFRPPSDHYENFPVASWLCPRELRAPIAAIYWFARVADDLADEGNASAGERLDALTRYRDDLAAVAAGTPHSGSWSMVFDPLPTMLRRFALPLPLLDQLLDAFVQDVQFTAAGRRYRDDAELMDYCRRSANPVGRLLLHLYRIDDAVSLARSDQICSALQLVNFWQDLKIDVARGRWYPSLEQMARHGVAEDDLRSDAPNPRASAMVEAYVAHAVALMHQGAPLVRTVPGRAGWELRFVVQGGLRIADKISRIGHATWRQRPRLTRRDLPLLLWRAMRHDGATPGMLPA